LGWGVSKPKEIAGETSGVFFGSPEGSQAKNPFQLGVVVHACNPSPGEVEAGYETGDQPGLCNETLSQRQNKTRPQGCFFGERE
jgi:hypothetical protein